MNKSRSFAYFARHAELLDEVDDKFYDYTNEQLMDRKRIEKIRKQTDLSKFVYDYWYVLFDFFKVLEIDRKEFETSLEDNVRQSLANCHIRGQHPKWGGSLWVNVLDGRKRQNRKPANFGWDFQPAGYLSTWLWKRGGRDAEVDIAKWLNGIQLPDKCIVKKAGDMDPARDGPWEPGSVQLSRLSLVDYVDGELMDFDALLRDASKSFGWVTAKRIDLLTLSK